MANRRKERIHREQRRERALASCRCSDCRDAGLRSDRP